MPLISIVIPVYNTEKYLPECLSSIVSQDFDDYEVILVDDGSSDASPKICDDYCQKYNNFYVIHKQNEGLVAARQDGTKIASGRYISPVDSDDFVSNDFFITLKKYIDKYKPDIICFTGYQYKNKKKQKIPLNYSSGFYNRQKIESDIFPSLIQSKKATKFNPNLFFKCIRRSLYLDNSNINKKITMGEDSAVSIPCIVNCNSMYIIDKCLYYYRYNDLSMTKNKKPFDINFPIYLNNQLHQMIDINQYDFKEQLYRKTTHGIFNAFVSQFYNQKYFKTTKILKKIINKKAYSDPINNARFSKSIKTTLMKYSLKYRLFILLYLYSRIR